MRRIGRVAPAFANWQDVTGGTIEAKNPRFIGVSYDGITDGKTAKDFPDEQGRFSVAVQGAVTIFCNEKDLDGANIGDYLGWTKQASDFVWSDGSSKFSPVKIGKYTDGASGPTTRQIFGVLLEKGSDTGRRNEARVLLNPAYGTMAYKADGTEIDLHAPMGSSLSGIATSAKMSDHSAFKKAVTTNGKLRYNTTMANALHDSSGSELHVRSGPNKAIGIAFHNESTVSEEVKQASNALLSTIEPTAQKLAKKYINRWAALGLDETGVNNDTTFYAGLRQHIKDNSPATKLPSIVAQV